MAVALPFKSERFRTQRELNGAESTVQIKKQGPRRNTMMAPTKVTVAPAVRTAAAKFALALVLAATPLVAIGIAALDHAPVTFAGSSYPDDIDPG